MIELLLDGSLRLDPTRSSETQDRMLLSLNTCRGSLITQETFGSELHLLRQHGVTDATPVRAIRMAESALKWMVDQGLIWDLSVDAWLSNTSRLVMLISASARNETISMETWISVPRWNG